MNLVTPTPPVGPLRGPECENPSGAAAPFPRGRGTFLASLRRQGLTLSLVAGKVKVRGKVSALTPDLLAELRDRQAELVAALAEAATCARCGAPLEDGRVYCCPTCTLPPVSSPDHHPSLTADGLLIIPCDAEPRFRWWQGGQSAAQTAAELGATISLYSTPGKTRKETQS